MLNLRALEPPAAGPADEATADTAPQDRRRFPRITSLPAASLLVQGVPAKLLDLGLGGALVESSARLLPGAGTNVRLSAGDVDLQARARIRRASVTQFVRATRGETALLYRGGLEFESLSPAELRAVKTLLTGARQSLRRGHAAQSPILPPAADSTSAARQPDSLVSIRFPPGWVLTRRASTVVATAPNAQGFVLLRTLAAAAGQDLCEFAQRSMREAGFSVMDWRPAVVNGLTGCLGFYHGWVDGIGEVIAEAAHVTFENQLYLVAGVASWSTYETMRHEFFAAIRSFGGKASSEGARVKLQP